MLSWSNPKRSCPPLAGRLVVGLVVVFATRYLTGGGYTHGTMSA